MAAVLTRGPRAAQRPASNPRIASRRGRQTGTRKRSKYAEGIQEPQNGRPSLQSHAITSAQAAQLAQTPAGLAFCAHR